MSHEAATSPNSRNDFLRSFFSEEFDSSNPGWIEFETVSAHWRVVALPQGGQKVVAVRTSQIGTVDSYFLDLDNPEEDSHVVVDSEASLTGAINDVEAQIEMGLATPDYEVLVQLEELLDHLRLVDSIS
jgi:hypothetical protein